MTTPASPAPGSSTVRAAPSRTGQWRSDPRLSAYLLAGFGGLVAALATGQPEWAALGAPFLALGAAGLRDVGSRGLGGQVRMDVTRVREGDLVEGQVRVEWQGEAEVDVRLAGWRGLTPVEPEPEVGWGLPAGRGPATLPFRLRAQSWGDHQLGALWVRLRRPGGLIMWEQEVARAPRLRVLPGPLRLKRLLRPAEPRAVAGMHLSRLRGRGTDFAELREYRAGDRMRDLSWSASARLGAPWVMVHHPERTGSVLLLLDGFQGGERARSEALARAARAAWAVASIHLRAQDRVGLLSQGPRPAWLPPQGGQRARWMLLDALLTVGSAVEDRSQRRRLGARVAVPADALVVGITSLRSRAFVGSLLHHRRAGHTTVALVLDTSDLLPDAADRLDQAVRRIWLADRAAVRHGLERGGVPTALVIQASGVAPAIAALQRRTERRRTVRLGGRK